MFNYFILGALQGIAEWLPISSEGVLVLAQIFLFGQELPLNEMIRVALFLHLGSVLAVIIYFWQDILKLIKTFFNYRKSSFDEKSFINFLVIASFFTGVVGIIIYKFLEKIEGGVLASTGATLMIFIGFLLLVTAFLQHLAKKQTENKLRDINNLQTKDSIITGIVQGMAVLPGLSRSGSTVATLLLLKIKDHDALKISFLMGLPIILGANVVLNFEMFGAGINEIVGLITSFIFSLLTIHLLLKVAQKISFVWFTLGFGLLTILAGVLAFWL